MNYAIIAAGEGSRLVKEGITTPKPLISINDEPMIDRLIRIFADNRASTVHIIVNEEMDEVYKHLTHTTYPVPLHIIRKSTPSSLHSFYELSALLGNDRFCLTTVDTIFDENEFSLFIEDFQHCRFDGLFAVTEYIDDEKPLYVETDENRFIKNFNDHIFPGSRYVSGGIYCLSTSNFALLKNAIDAGMTRLRNYQRHLIQRGLKIKAWPFSKILDVDRHEDIDKAERFLKERFINS